jgi:FlgD Ig-like domain/Photosynthesis system II assembly factor YCF48
MTNSSLFQWTPTNAPLASSRTDDIWFVDPLIGWAVNSNGQILKTEDGGESWTQQFQDNVYLRCVGFATPLKGWVGTLTEQKRLYSTTDGGNSWNLVQNLPNLAPEAICGLSVVNESVVYASGTNFPFKTPRMIKTVGYASGKTVYKYATAPVISPLVARVASLSFLSTNAPAKFDRSVQIEYTLPEHTQTVRIDIWNQFGADVRKLVDQTNPSAGQKSVVWDGKDDAGTSLPPGIFIYRLTVDGNAESRVIRFYP